MIVGTEGQLIVAARKAGIEPSIDDKGRPYYQLEWDEKGQTLRIAKVKADHRPVGLRLTKLVDAALKAGVKPRKDAQGNSYLTAVVTGNKVEIETTGVDNLKTAKAISPQKGK